MAGETPVGKGLAGWQAAIVAVGVVVGGATCGQPAVAVLHGHQAAKMVSEEVVVGVGAAGDEALGDGAAGNGQGDTDGLAGLAGVFHLVVGEGGVGDEAVGAGGFDPDSIGIVAESGGLAIDDHAG